MTYASDFFSIGVEYRALPFSWNRAGFDSRGTGNNGQFPDGKIDSQDATFKFNQMVTIALPNSVNLTRFSAQLWLKDTFKSCDFKLQFLTIGFFDSNNPSTSRLNCFRFRCYLRS